MGKGVCMINRSKIFKMKEDFSKFLNEESGQSTTEYILILAVVVMIAMKFRYTFGDRMNGIVQKVTNEIDQAATNSN